MYNIFRVRDMIKTMKNYLDTMTFDAIIDVREIEEYNQGHLKGAINIPLNTIQECQLDKQKKIAIYCRSGQRSQIATNILKQQGFTNITNIGGVIDGSVPLTNE